MQQHMPWRSLDGEVHGRARSATYGGGMFIPDCKTIPMPMARLDGEWVPGSIVSVELANSDAPLLLNSHGQKRLGLVIDTAAGTVYKKLDLSNYNGLPAPGFLPHHHGSVNDSIALVTGGVFAVKSLCCEILFAVRSSLLQDPLCCEILFALRSLCCEIHFAVGFSSL